MSDKTISCIQCGTSFVFTAQEQARFMARGFNMPKRCPECRKNKSKWAGLDNGRKEAGKKRSSHRKEDFDSLQ